MKVGRGRSETRPGEGGLGYGGIIVQKMRKKKEKRKSPNKKETAESQSLGKEEEKKIAIMGTVDG